MFYYCDYWKTWNRMLFDNSCQLDLTPINGWSDYHNAQKIRLETFRPAPQYRGLVDKLPDEVFKEIVREAGETFAVRLLTYPYPKITAEDVRVAFQRTNGGGVPYCHILRVMKGSTSNWHW